MSVNNLPNFNNIRWVNKDGMLSPESLLYNDQMYQTLNRAITVLNLITDGRVINDGSVNRGTVVNDVLKAPQKTTAEITGYASDTSFPNGSIWFDTDVSKLKVKTASGTIETITSS